MGRHTFNSQERPFNKTRQDVKLSQANKHHEEFKSASELEKKKHVSSWWNLARVLAFPVLLATPTFLSAETAKPTGIENTSDSQDVKNRIRKLTSLSFPEIRKIMINLENELGIFSNSRPELKPELDKHDAKMAKAKTDTEKRQTRAGYIVYLQDIKNNPNTKKPVKTGNKVEEKDPIEERAKVIMIELGVNMPTARFFAIEEANKKNQNPKLESPDITIDPDAEGLKKFKKIVEEDRKLNGPLDSNKIKYDKEKKDLKKQKAEDLLPQLIGLDTSYNKESKRFWGNPAQRRNAIIEAIMNIKYPQYAKVSPQTPTPPASVQLDSSPLKQKITSSPSTPGGRDAEEDKAVDVKADRGSQEIQKVTSDSATSTPPEETSGFVKFFKSLGDNFYFGSGEGEKSATSTATSTPSKGTLAKAPVIVKPPVIVAEAPAPAPVKEKTPEQIKQENTEARKKDVEAKTEKSRKEREEREYERLKKLNDSARQAQAKVDAVVAKTVATKPKPEIPVAKVVLKKPKPETPVAKVVPKKLIEEKKMGEKTVSKLNQRQVEINQLSRKLSGSGLTETEIQKIVEEKYGIKLANDIAAEKKTTRTVEDNGLTGEFNTFKKPLRKGGKPAYVVEAKPEIKNREKEITFGNIRIDRKDYSSGVDDKLIFGDPNIMNQAYNKNSESVGYRPKNPEKSPFRQIFKKLIPKMKTYSYEEDMGAGIYVQGGDGLVVIPAGDDFLKISISEALKDSDTRDFIETHGGIEKYTIVVDGIPSFILLKACANPVFLLGRFCEVKK